MTRSRRPSLRLFALRAAAPVLLLVTLPASITGQTANKNATSTPTTNSAGETTSIPALWNERTACTVAVEYLVETEVERHENMSFGTVLDREGLIVLPPVAVNLRYSPDQLRQFKVYLPGESTGTTATYLGVDPLTGWHFVRAAESVRPKLRPVTDFVAKGAPLPPSLTEEVWGIGLRNKDEDFMPYVMLSRVALLNKIPQATAIAQQEVTSPGLPVFNRRGDFIGIGLSAFGQSYIQFSRSERGGAPVMLVNVEETSAFLLAEEALPQFTRVPSSPYGRPIPWLGTFGIQPVDAEVARLLRLENQSAAVVSEVLEGSPAEKAGLKERDIIVAIEGSPLPRFRPDRAVATYIDRVVDSRKPGDAISLTVLRGDQRISVTAILADSPKLAREATRRYFERLGFTGRECVYSDAIMRRAPAAEVSGLIAHFIKSGSAAQSAGLLNDDWIREIDGVPVKTAEDAFNRLALIEKDSSRNDFVMLVRRGGGDTAILRIKLK